MSAIKEIKVVHAGGKYSILTGRHLLEKAGGLVKPLIRPGATTLIVSNRKVAGLFLSEISRALQREGFKT